MKKSVSYLSYCLCVLEVLREISIRRNIATHIVRDAGLGVTVAEAPFRTGLAAKRISMPCRQTVSACRGRDINKGLIMIHKGTFLGLLLSLHLLLLSLLLYHVLKTRHDVMHFHLSNVTDQGRQKCHNKGKEHKHSNNTHCFLVRHLLAVGEVFYGARCCEVLPFLLNVDGGSSEFHIGPRIKIIHLFLLFDTREHLGLTPQFRRTHLEFSMHFGLIPKDSIL